MERKINLGRKSKETDINIELNLDGKGNHKIDTSIGFLDHLLTQVAVHGSFDMSVAAEGDLDVDNHHIIEDTAIVLGQAFFKALGNKSGIMRVGHSYFPMDDSLAFVVIDISSRPFFIKDINWINPFLGSKEENLIPVDLIEHFLYTFSINAQITLHIRVLYGENNHHIAEAIFKALGKALDLASRMDSKRNNIIPSSKGIL